MVTFRQVFRIKYIKDIQSDFSDSTSEVSFYIMLSCWEIGDKKEDFGNYNPF